MQAVIMCAGNSTRTYPLTLTKPKPLLRVANKTILAHNLEELQGIVDKAILIVGYKKEMIKSEFKDSYKKIKITYVEQEIPNGTGGALLTAKELLEERFIVLNGDDLFAGADIKKCLGHRYCLLGKEVENISQFGEISIKGNLVDKLVEKPATQIKGLANTGLYVLDKDIFTHTLQKSKRGEFEIVDYIRFLLEKKEDVFFERASSWLPITYPWSLLDANDALLGKIIPSKKGKVESGATIIGTVQIGKGTRILAGAYIEGPVIIGDNCKIGPNCYIRANTTIGNYSKIGNAVEVKNSIIGDNTSIGHLSYVGDSIIGDHVNFGAGTITANLKHDNANVRSQVKDTIIDTGRRKLGTVVGDKVHTGIHTSIYPGRKIWPEKMTLPGEIVIKDIV
ncbi:MAG: NTP transferase domain-containing protein [Nanoarchaeota archaeon]|nr:NTP transferase domain-containing protein [Nanoarchaeota archaeon]